MSDFQNRCQIRKGMFALSECGKISMIQCPRCDKNFCGKHGKQLGSSAVCVECYVAQEAEHPFQFKNEKHRQAVDIADDLWYYSARTHFYRSNNFDPLETFDSDDFGNFNQMGEQEFADDLEGNHFFDS